MPEIKLLDVTKIYPFQKVTGLFGRKQQELILKQQKSMPHLSNEGVIALQHFTTTIKDGEFVAVLGPSGSGKSTLLRVIAGLEYPSVGMVRFDDVDFNDVRAEDRDVAMVFQNYSLYPNQTVYKNIAFPLEVKHMPREDVEREVRQIAELMNLDDKLERLPQELSGGEKQRVAIARSLVKRPGVLLLDEPFSNLDPEMRAKLRVQLKKIHNVYKTTFIYVTHDQYDALYLADRIIILKDGITQMDDTAVNVYNYPVNRFCAEFIGTPLMNFFDDVKVEMDGSFEILGNRYQLSNQQRHKIRNNMMVDVGIRGTNISIGREGVSAKIVYTEMIESDLIIHLKAAEHEMVAVEKISNFDEVKYLPEQEVKITLDSEYFHVFDKEGNRV
ncbi:MAG: ABC transporter ATP-binding protein [Erysipelotrichaceae bacterium]|nr:ABC transporter ATP-binding protein [Erysipelotrichaceae bacterium]